MHMGVIVDSASVQEHWPELKQLDQEADFFEFGMGEDPFFREKNHSLIGGMKAMLIPTPSLVRVHPFKGTVSQYYKEKNVAVFEKADQQVKDLLHWVKNDLKNGLKTIDVDNKKNYRFYARKGEYHFFANCNHWVADAFEQLSITIGWSEKLWSSRMFDALSKFSKDYKKPYTKGSWLTTFEKYL